ncbi:hypothetical protein CR513_16421, partial [Mucuna pruriens]
AAMAFTFHLHYMGYFVREPNMHYKEAEVHEYKDLDVHTWSFFEAIDLKKKNSSFEEGLKELVLDKDALELSNYVIQNKCEVVTYLEYPYFQTNNMDEGDDFNTKGVDGNRSLPFENDNESKKAMMNLLMNEEVRDMGLDDGFYEVPEAGIERGIEEKNGTNNLNIIEGEDYVQVGGFNDIVAIVMAETFIPPNMEAMHDIEVDYSSDELDSDFDSGSDGENKPYYPRYKEDMCRTFKFRLGMNRVGNNHTYKIKTLIGKHNCGRVFANKNAKSKWISKQLVDKLKSNSKLTLNEIIDDMRITFSTDITLSRAFKAKQLVREVVEGDASKQYSLLWSYSAELRRAKRPRGRWWR